jgi:branched-chain amino acid transport system substrate-binding protein
VANAVGSSEKDSNTEMKAMPTDDKLFGKGRIREDGSVIHPIYLYQVNTLPGEEAFGPLNKACPLVPG